MSKSPPHGTARRSRTQTALRRYALRDISIIDTIDHQSRVGFSRKRRGYWVAVRPKKRAVAKAEELIGGQGLPDAGNGGIPPELVEEDRLPNGEVSFRRGNGQDDEGMLDQHSLLEMPDTDDPLPDLDTGTSQNLAQRYDEEEDVNSYVPSQPFKPRRHNTHISTRTPPKPLGSMATDTETEPYSEPSPHTRPTTPSEPIFPSESSLATLISLGRRKEPAMGYWQKAEQGMLTTMARKGYIDPFGTTNRIGRTRSPPVNLSALEDLAERKGEEENKIDEPRFLGNSKYENQQIDEEEEEEAEIIHDEEIKDDEDTILLLQPPNLPSMPPPTQPIQLQSQALNPPISLDSAMQTAHLIAHEDEPPSSDSSHYPSDEENNAPLHHHHEVERSSILPPRERRVLLGELREDDTFDPRTEALKLVQYEAGIQG